MFRLKKLMFPIAFIIFFLYGLAVGHLHIFPFNQIQAVKELVLSKNPSTLFIKSPYYLSKTTFFKVNSRNQYDVVFIGDSITDHSNWHDIFTDVTIANRGIAGDTTLGVLNRMDTITNTGARKAFIMIGINDIIKKENIETIFNNYVEILKTLKSKNIEPIVQSTLLTYDKPNQLNESVNRLNDMLIKFCADSEITYIDLNHHLTTNGLLEKKYSYDGLHLNGEGYLVWSKVISNHVK